MTLSSDHVNGNSALPNNNCKKIGEYVVLKTIGQGTFGKVKLAQHIMTGEKVAIKCITKANVKTTKQINSVQREIRLMKLLRHPHIVEVKEAMEDPYKV